MRRAKQIFLVASLALCAGCADDASDEATPMTAVATGTGADGGHEGGAPDGSGSSGSEADGDTGAGDVGSGPGDDATGIGETGSGETGGPDLGPIELACAEDCAAKADTGCLVHGIEQCMFACVHITVNLDGFCLGEYEHWVQCQADTGYACTAGNPIPTMVCEAELDQYAACTDNLACKRVCEDEMDAGCLSGSWDECVDACTVERNSHPETCWMHVNSLLTCVGNLDLVCAPDLDFDDCDHSLGSAGDCIADELDDPCAGWCFAGDFLGCGDGCEATCAQGFADPNCGGFFDMLVHCQLSRPDLECVDGRLQSVDGCVSEQTDYESCLAG